ncbi:MAG: hypothetical protein J6N46_01905 [Bacteroidales bacterium]|nr:hypothetical protein [Bacteroidales bacterium]
MDNLNQYINRNREAFDDKDLPEGHLDRFEERLGSHSLNNRSGRLWRVLTGSEAALREQGTTIRDRVIKLRGNRRRIGWAIGIAAALAALVTIGWPAGEEFPSGFGKGDEGSSIIIGSPTKDWFAGVGNDQFEICTTYYDKVAELYEDLLRTSPDSDLQNTLELISEENIPLIEQLPEEMEPEARAEVLKEYYGNLLDGLERIRERQQKNIRI